VTQPAEWRTDEPCPDCGAGLVLLGHGGPVQVAECRACGYFDSWEFADEESAGDAG
jgi:hypothetical protein